MSQTSNNLAAYSWSIADLLRGDFKQSQYGRIILPFTLLRRLECVLAPTKPKVLAEVDKLAKQKLPEEAREKFLLRATGGLSFFNTSRMDLGTLGETGIKSNLDSYVAAFSKDAREIFEYFNFSEFVGQLNDANLLYKVVQRVRLSDLSPSAVSNHEMGLVFEELIRRFAESSNETAGEHFTPRDIVHLTTSLVFMEDDDALTKPGIIRTIYDPTAGTGGFLSAGMEYVHTQNPRAVIRAYGQELNPESYAICKADMLIKGQEVSNIKLGNTLSADQLHAQKFDYMLSNPPFGVDWKKIEGDITREHLEKGFDGRFGPGLPRVSDGSLLFLLHLLSKLRDPKDGGGRVGIILNGSPLFTGGAGSGESEIRRHLLESDLVVTSSRKEAVRYKLSFDKYIAEKGYAKLYAMVAFSGEVEFNEKDPNSAGVLGQKFTEITMNPGLKGRDLRKAFDSGDYQVMIVANKFQTGFDKPKLCAMYVDKKLGGVECVQTLSRLNRVYPGKADTGTFVLDFFNEPEDILAAFLPYYQTAKLDDVSDPNLIFDLNEKLRASGIFQWTEVEQFCTAFFQKSKSNAALANICKPAMQRWQIRYKAAVLAYQQSRDLVARAKKTGDVVLITNTENGFKAAKKDKDALEIFKKDLGTFVRFYEFMSQIVDYDDTSLEKLSLYARNLSPLLREQLLDEEDIDLNQIVLSHYRLSKIRQQDLLLNEDAGPYGLKPGEGMGTAKAHDPKEEFLSQIIARLNEIFVTDHLTDGDQVTYAYAVRDKLRENDRVMHQLANNSDAQALLGDFPKAVDDAILDSGEAFENQKLQLLADPKKAAAFAKLIFELLKAAG